MGIDKDPDPSDWIELAEKARLTKRKRLAWVSHYITSKITIRDFVVIVAAGILIWTVYSCQTRQALPAIPDFYIHENDVHK